LASSFVLYDKPGKEAWIEPQVEGDSYRFAVKVGKPPNEAEVKGGTKLSRGAHFRCLMSGSPISSEHIYAEANAGRLGARLMAVVAEGRKGKVYLPPTEEMERIARSARPAWKPELPMPENPRWFSPPLYGLPAYGDLYTERQLTALNAFSDLTHEVRKVVLNDALVAGMTDDRIPLSQGGSGATAYADAIAMYLAFAGSRMADRHSTLCRWDPNPSGYAPKIANTFGRHALPMVWDYVEGNPFSPSSGNFSDAIGWVAKVLDTAVSPRSNGSATQADAQTQTESTGKIVSTDPPYYDNIGYADLSDYFYVWLRRSLKDVFPDLFATVAVPKAEELVATPYRHGGRSEAEAFFLAGMTQAMKRLAEQSHPAFPVTIYYAFKQSEGDGADGTTNTGWETFLEAVLRAGFAITGTWPMRTELINRMVGAGTNALASSIVLVCRKRANAAPSVSRREFLRELNVALPEALDEMIHGSGGNRSPVAPVDLSQAIIGPGMAVFSSFSAVLEADGSPMGVRTALQLINRFLTDDDFDADTQFCARWFEQHGWKAGKFGDADTLSRAKGTSVEGVRAAGVIESGGGQVRLLKWSEYDASWDPKTDTRNPVWETLHHLVRALKQGGESAAGRLLTAVRDKGEPARQLAYRLYTLCERQSWAEDARVYNEIITSWSGIEAAAGTASAESVQGKLFD
jgi:putative DNA methylase